MLTMLPNREGGRDIHQVAVQTGIEGRSPGGSLVATTQSLNAWAARAERCR